ncbi:MAG: hypothetical protein QXY45_00090 [Candidatus Aenigmatarchaeota archaeon]
MKNVFLDANVIADWLLVYSKLKNTKNHEEKELKLRELWKQYTAPKICFEILEIIRNKKMRNFSFFTSDLALAEVGDVIFKESRSIDLIKSGIAYRYIPSMIKKVVLTKDEINNIMNQIKTFREIFLGKKFSENKIKVHNKLEDPTFPVYLISLFRIETYDAYLISQAYDAKCCFFITKDEKLRKEVKFDGLSLISPEKFLEELKKQ